MAVAILDCAPGPRPRWTELESRGPRPGPPGRGLAAAEPLPSRPPSPPCARPWARASDAPRGVPRAPGRDAQGLSQDPAPQRRPPRPPQAASGMRVTDVALDYGFLHFGWFSQDYRRLFGETPRQTLQRATRPERWRGGTGRSARLAGGRPRGTCPGPGSLSVGRRRDDAAQVTDPGGMSDAVRPALGRLRRLCSRRPHERGERRRPVSFLDRRGSGAPGGDAPPCSSS